MASFWTCQRVCAGVRCGHKNPRVKQKCVMCGGPRPKRKRPAHMGALDLPYEVYVEINGGEHCGICGRLPAEGRRLDRDHEHSGDGRPRGLLCWACNTALDNRKDADWFRAAARYLTRAEMRPASKYTP